MVYSYSIVRSMGADTTPWKKWKAPGVIVRNGRGKPNLGSEVGMPSFDVWVEVRRRSRCHWDCLHQAWGRQLRLRRPFKWYLCLCQLSPACYGPCWCLEKAPRPLTAADVPLSVQRPLGTHHRLPFLARTHPSPFPVLPWLTRKSITSSRPEKAAGAVPKPWSIG